MRWFLQRSDEVWQTVMQKCGRNILGREMASVEVLRQECVWLKRANVPLQLGQTDPCGGQQKRRCQRQWRQSLQDILNHSEGFGLYFLRTGGAMTKLWTGKWPDVIYSERSTLTEPAQGGPRIEAGRSVRQLLWWPGKRWWWSRLAWQWEDTVRGRCWKNRVNRILQWTLTWEKWGRGKSRMILRSEHPAGAAAKSRQSYPTLCDPIDSSPPGSPVPGILQTRTLDWVAISFSNAWKWKVKVKLLSHVWLLTTPWTVAY